MVRGRVKGKKQNKIIACEGSTEELKVPPPTRRRGRPSLKDGIEEVKTQKIQDEDGNSHISREDVKNDSNIENGTKRNRSAYVNDTIINMNSIHEDKSTEIKSSLDDPVKSVGFRQSGSKRKNKPHRAAEAGVQCK